jgi:hypothetical protein
MATVLESVLPEGGILLWAKGLNAKNIHKELFPVYGGNCLSRITCLTLIIHLTPSYETAAARQAFFSS